MSGVLWKEYTLNDLCIKITSGGTPLRSKSEYYEAGNIPWLKTKEVANSRIYTTENFITEEGLANSSAKLIPANSVIVAMYGDGETAGRVAINKIPLTTNQACCNLIIDDRIADYEYIYYYLLKSYEQLVNLKLGSGQQNLNAAIIKNIPINLPELSYQKKVSTILSSIDDKIELNRQIAQTLEAIAQAIFKEWFVDFNFPGATGETQVSELGEIPKGWKVVAFEEQLSSDRGLSYKGNGLSQNDGIPMHNLNSIFEGGGYKMAGIKYYTGEYKEKHIVEPGDLIIANTEQGHKYLLIGYPAIVPSYYGEKGIFSHHIYKLKPKQNSYLASEFLFHLLLQPEIREQVVGFANGTTVNMLKIEGLQKPKFVLPKKEIVESFTKIASSLRNQTSDIIQQNQTLTLLRDSLLPKLMKGDIQIQNLT